MAEMISLRVPDIHLQELQALRQGDFMTLSVTQLATAKQAANEILEELGLRAYRFEVEPEDGDWLIHVECAVAEGWMSTQFSEDDALLQQSQNDPAVRDRLLKSWRAQLGPCIKEP